MARASASDPLAAATNFLALRGLDDGDFIWVEGSDGSLGNVPVIFITDAGLAQTAMVLMPATTKKATGKKSAVAGSKRSGSGSGKKGGAKKAGGKKSSGAKGSAKRSTGKKSGKGSGK
jgi:hypothetical protein